MNTFTSDWKQRAERAGEVAEFFVLPVEEALENLHGQRFAGGEDGAQGGAHVFAEFLQVGELALEVLEEDSAEALRELFRSVERDVAALNVVAEAFGVEEHAFALFQDLFHEAVGVRAGLELRREFVAQVFAEVGAVGFGGGVEDERVQALQRGAHVALRPAGDDETNPVGQARGVAREHFDEFVAPVAAGFVKRVNDDDQALASAGDGELERVGEEIVEQFGGGLLAVEFGNLRQGEQELAVVGQPGGKLEGEGADDARGTAVVGLVVGAEVDADNCAASVEVREVGGEEAFAKSGRAHHPKDARAAVGGGAPFFHGVEEPRAAREFFLQQLLDARIGGEIGDDGLEIFFERPDFTGELPALVALHNADDLGEFFLIPLFPCRIT